MLAGPSHALRHQAPPDPARPAILDELLETGARQLAAPGAPVLAYHLPFQAPGEVLLGGLFPDAPAGRPAVGHLAHGIEAGAVAIDDLAHVPVDGQGLVGNRSLALTVHVGGGDVHEVDAPLRGPGQLHQGQRPPDVGLDRHVQGLVEDDGCGAVEDRVDLGRQSLPILGGQSQIGLTLVDGHREHLLSKALPPAGVGLRQALKESRLVQILQTLVGGDFPAIGSPAGTDHQVDAADLLPEVAQDLGQQRLADEARTPGDQQTSVCVVLTDHQTWREPEVGGEEGRNSPPNPYVIDTDQA